MMILSGNRADNFTLTYKQPAFIRSDAAVFSSELYGSGDSISILGGGRFETESSAILSMMSPGEAIIKDAFSGLRCSHIIYTKSPVYSETDNGETAVLRSCYFQSMKTAEELGLRSIVFPVIGACGSYPVEKALEIAVTSIREYLEHSSLKVTLSLFGKAEEKAAQIKVPGLEEVRLLTQRPARQAFSSIPEFMYKKAARKNCLNEAAGAISSNECPEPVMPLPEQKETAEADQGMQMMHTGIEADKCDFSSDLMADIVPEGESFVEMLIRFEASKNMSDPELYHKAGITRACFNNIINGRTKNPSRQTIVALAMAMKLSYDEASELMEAAGLAFSKNNPFDIIAGNCFKAGFYDIWKINAALAERGLPLIGQQG